LCDSARAATRKLKAELLLGQSAEPSSGTEGTSDHQTTPTNSTQYDDDRTSSSDIRFKKRMINWVLVERRF